jgi:hypothetical protein
MMLHSEKHSEKSWRVDEAVNGLAGRRRRLFATGVAKELTNGACLWNLSYPRTGGD